MSFLRRLLGGSPQPQPAVSVALQATTRYDDTDQLAVVTVAGAHVPATIYQDFRGRRRRDLDVELQYRALGIRQARGNLRGPASGLPDGGSGAGRRRKPAAAGGLANGSGGGCGAQGCACLR